MIRKNLRNMITDHCFRTCLSSAQTLRARSPGQGLSVYDRLDGFLPWTLDGDTARAIDQLTTLSGFLLQVAPRPRTSSFAAFRCRIVPGRKPYGPLTSRLILWQAYEIAVRNLGQSQWLGRAYNCLPIT
jgi:hypothetical protein